jgi:signal transduction histidine kinase
MSSKEEGGVHDKRSEYPEAVLDRITDPVFAVDDEFRVTDANDAALSLFREASSETLNEATFRGSHIEEYGWLAGTSLGDLLEEAVSADEPIEFEEYYEPIESWLEGRSYPSETGVSVFLQAVRPEDERHGDLSDRMSVVRRSYEVMSDRSRSFDERVLELLEIGSAELGLDYGMLSNVRGKEEYVFEVVRSQDIPVEAGYTIPLEEFYCERTVLDRERLVLADVTREAPELTDRAGYTMFGISSYVGCPVVVDEEVYGSFCLCDGESRDRAFSDWEITIVEMMTELISYTLERRQAEKRLQHQNERLEQFASVLSHDLQTPLSIARGTLEMIETDNSEHVSRIDRAHERMSEIISDSIEMARQGNPVEDRSRIDLAAAGERAWETVDTADATLEAETATIYADEPRLHRLLENLYRNAIQHAGPSVTVSLGTLEDADGFYVEDDGPGIPPTERDEVLEFGYSTEEGGTGFGLSIVNHIAEAHGWSVRVTGSQVGGARFEFVELDMNS